MNKLIPFFLGLFIILVIVSLIHSSACADNEDCSPTPSVQPSLEVTELPTSYDCEFNGFSHSCVTIAPSESPTATLESTIENTPTAGQSAEQIPTSTPQASSSEVMVMPSVAPATGRGE